MRDYVYRVSGTNLDDPIDGNQVDFKGLTDAEAFIEEAGIEDATIDMLIYEVDDFNDDHVLVDKVQVKGPEVDAIVATSDADHNSCIDSDCDDFDFDDDLDEEFVNELYSELRKQKESK